MKKLFSILIIINVFLFFCAASNANSEAEAKALIQKAAVAKNDDAKYEYLLKAKDLYLADYEENPVDIDTLVGLSRVYALLNDRKNAKVYILQAYNIHPEYPGLQKGMGDFYYSFQEYSTAIEYYKLALSNGLLRDYETNIRTAQCYDKLGDEENAELYYKISAHLNPSSKIAANRLNAITSQRIEADENFKKKPKYYYIFNGKKGTKEEQIEQDADNITKELQERK